MLVKNTAGLGTRGCVVQFAVWNVYAHPRHDQLAYACMADESTLQQERVAPVPVAYLYTYGKVLVGRETTVRMNLTGSRHLQGKEG